MRFVINNAHDRLAVLSACYGGPERISAATGLPMTKMLRKGGGRDTDNYINGLDAAVIVEDDDCVMGWGTL